MKASDLCDYPDETLGKRLSRWQSLLLYKVLPSSFGLLLYIILIVADSALIYQHSADGNPRWATVCILLSFAPSVVTFIFTLAIPVQWPKAQDQESGLESDEPWDHQLNGVQLKWLGLQCLNMLFFPIAAISRYCHQIFWSVEAVCATWIEDKIRLDEAIVRLYQPSPVELYLFLQAFLHAAPNALLQLHLFLGYDRNHNSDTASIQVLSIMMSILRMAAVATVFQRFERQKVVGRRYPWVPIKEIILPSTEIEAVEHSVDTETAKEEIKREEIPVRKVNSQVLFGSDDEDSFDGTESMINYEEETNLNVTQTKNRDKSFSVIDKVARRRSSGSEYLPPKGSKHTHDDNDVQVSNDDEIEKRYRKLVSVEDNERAAMNRITNYNITDMSQYTTPPSMVAPRFPALANLKSRISTGAEAFTERMPQRRPRPPSLDLPVRVKSAAVRGLEREDFTAQFIEFLAWFLFLISRMLALASFTRFFPVVSFWLMFTHYSIMFLTLITNCDRIMRRAFYLFLGFVYVFCLVEFKVRFRHVRLWYAGWTFLCAAETVAFTSAWAASVMNNVVDSSDSWWYGYTIMLIGGSAILGYACAFVYIAILKPRDKLVYPDGIGK